MTAYFQQFGRRSVGLQKPSNLFRHQTSVDPFRRTPLLRQVHHVLLDDRAMLVNITAGHWGRNVLYVVRVQANVCVQFGMSSCRAAPLIFQPHQAFALKVEGSKAFRATSHR